jgi:hypothetical protein
MGGNNTVVIAQRRAAAPSSQQQRITKGDPTAVAATLMSTLVRGSYRGRHPKIGVATRRPAPLAVTKGERMAYGRVLS